jgi:hypothetical protein
MAGKAALLEPVLVEPERPVPPAQGATLGFRFPVPHDRDPERAVRSRPAAAAAAPPQEEGRRPTGRRRSMTGALGRAIVVWRHAMDSLGDAKYDTTLPPVACRLDTHARR